MRRFLHNSGQDFHTKLKELCFVIMAQLILTQLVIFAEIPEPLQLTKFLWRTASPPQFVWTLVMFQGKHNLEEEKSRKS